MMDNPAIEHWPIDRLLPYAANARTHSDHQVAQIAGSIAAFGFNVPCLVDERGVLIAGHGRLLAARQLELETVPVIRLEHLSETQARAYRIADNRIAENAGWDGDILGDEFKWLREEAEFDLDITGFTLDEVDRLQQEDNPAGNEGAIHVPETPVSQAGDLWILGDHRLLCGDSTRAEDVKRLMRGERAVLFATDPPYLIDYDGTNHPSNWQSVNPNKDWLPSYGVTWEDSSQGSELYDGFIKAVIDEAIAEDAAWYCWHASRRQAMVESCWEKAGAFVHQQIIWVKDHGILTRSHYLWKHEPCFYGWVKGKRPPRVGDETPPTTWNIAGLYGDERPAQARTAHEIAKAQRARIEVQRLREEVVDRAQATSEVFRLARRERDAWVNWPARVAALMAAELGLDAHVMQKVLEGHVRDNLNDLAEIRPEFR